MEKKAIMLKIVTLLSQIKRSQKSQQRRSNALDRRKIKPKLLGQ